MDRHLTATDSLPATLNIRMAAMVLNISSSYLVHLLESGSIRYERSGRQRVMRTRDVLQLRNERDAQRHAVLNEMGRIDGELL